MILINYTAFLFTEILQLTEVAISSLGDQIQSITMEVSHTFLSLINHTGSLEWTGKVIQFLKLSAQNLVNLTLHFYSVFQIRDVELVKISLLMLSLWHRFLCTKR